MSFADLAALTIHDVKNRLAALAAGAEAEGDRATQQALLDAAGRLTNLLALYKAESGRLAVNVDAHAPEDLLAEIAAWPRAGTVELSVACDAAPALWYYDEALVRMVLLNAVQNALRHARQQLEIGACLSDDGEWLEFHVRDDGAGFPPGLIVAPTDPSPVRRDGTGLGLQLAIQVAALHRNGGRSGEVRLSNDGGAQFLLRLPK